VLLVGHSSGSFVMAMLAAELRRQDRAATLTGRLSLLSLGQNLANLAVYPGAQAFHADLQELAQEPRLPWLDITCPDDLLCFAGVDPYRSCGLPAPTGTPYPTLKLVALSQPKGWLNRLGLAFQQFDLHFRYLRQVPANHGFDPLSQLLNP
jgi:pimeloyl-ACP methyl ester carboxylesterase